MYKYRQFRYYLFSVNKICQGFFLSQLCFHVIAGDCSLNEGIECGICCNASVSVSSMEDMKKAERGKKNSA